MTSKTPMQKFTITEFKAAFPNDDVCLDYIRVKRYPERIDCPQCGKNSLFHKVTGRKVYACDHCGYHLSPTVGTIFDKSPTPLTLWFYAIYLMAQTRTGISAKQLERELGVTYKTAWRMFKMIRSRLDESGDAFGGNGNPVEVDETYVGGVRKGKRGRGASGKTAVVGAVERQGSVKAQVVPDTQAKTVMPFIAKAVEPGATIHTDEYLVYSQLARRGYSHKTVAHSEGEFVVANVHTNSIEGFWAQVKNAVNGVHHGVDPEYLQQYVNEYAFRYNHRNDTTPMFFSFLWRSVASPAEPPYQAL